MEVTLNAGAPERDLTGLKARLPMLPSDYFDFLQESDGGEGFVGMSPGYFVLWRAREIERFSSEYEVPKYLPGYVAVGTNGAGELYVFPSSGRPPGIFAVPAIGMEPTVVELLCSSFSGFISAMGQRWRH